jgi:hypothetical protein
MRGEREGNSSIVEMHKTMAVETEASEKVAKQEGGNNTQHATQY